jgi:glycosyltransferase involved in cell wall biosynthesis
MISVVIPVRNGMPWLEVQLQALEAQQCDGPWEVILADNGSSDGSREFAEEW